jgi:hypothetical protein
MSEHHWFDPSEMPSNIFKQAQEVGMWFDDIDHIWYVPDGCDIPDEIETICRRHGGPVVFGIEGGQIFVDYHA